MDETTAVGEFEIDEDAHTLITSTFSETITLGTANQYGFYLKVGSEYVTSFDIVSLSGGFFTLSAASINAFLSVDSLPVPIPPSALLLGSGVIGLLGVGVRRRKNS